VTFKEADIMNGKFRWSPSVCAVLFGASSLLGVATDTQPTLDDLLQIEPAAPKVVPQPAPDEAVDEAIRRRLQGINTADGLEMALREMEEAEGRIGEQLNAGIETQRLQESAMSRLDALIAEAKRQCSACRGGSSSSGNPRRQSTGSSANAKTTAKGAAKASESNEGTFSPGAVGPVGPDGMPLSQTRSEWGNLPPRLRDELVQSMKERFSLIYRTLTEAYYKRLAEKEQP
jgi:hypothetical protein